MSLTTKVVLNKVRKKEDGSYPLVIRVTYNRKIIYLPLGYTFHEKDFDAKNQRVRVSTKVIENTTRFNEEILEKVKNIYSVVSELEKSNAIQGMSMTEIKKSILGIDKNHEVTVFQFMERMISDLKSIGKFGNARIYNDSLNAWKNFRKDKDLYFNQITFKTLKEFEKFFLIRGSKPNTISVYLRTFRSAYNKAVKEGIISEENSPFRKYKIPNNKTRKKAVTLDVIAQIENYEPEPNTRLWNSKHYFLFSFYTRGMNFIDMAKLKIENIRDSRIFYNRQKTGGEFTIQIHPKAQRIIDLYSSNKVQTDYLFPIVKTQDNPEKSFLEIKNGLNYFNKALKTISTHLGLDIKLSTYTARHSYATGLKMKGLSSEVIKESLGHTSVAVTEGYLKSFENSVVDEADNALFG
ncbi:MAG: site-specific integrase [Cyclobacteriaceae bacterium]